MTVSDCMICHLRGLSLDISSVVDNILDTLKNQSTGIDKSAIFSHQNKIAGLSKFKRIKSYNITWNWVPFNIMHDTK